MKTDNMQIKQYETPEIQQQQFFILKKQLFYSRLIAMLLLIITISLGASIVTIVPKVNHVLADVEEISRDLNSQEPIDVDSFNKAINNLDSILSPLAEFFKKK